MDLCPEPLWKSLCRDDPSATFYHTPAWLAIGARHFDAEAAPLLFGSGEDAACLPLLKKNRFGADRYFNPFGTYSSLLCRRKLGAPGLEAISARLHPLHLHLISSPFTPNPVGAGKPSVSKVQVIDLAALDRENPMRDWEEGQRRRVRVARRNEVTVRKAEKPEEWDRYYALYELSLRRWGGKATHAYPKALFDDIRVRLAGQPSLTLWLAEHRGEIGAGYLTFYHNRHVVPWHGAADSQFFNLGAAQILFLTIIEDAMARGFGIFDLTGSGGLSGVESFKSRFGPGTVEFPSWLNRPGFLGRVADMRDAISTLMPHAFRARK